MAQIKVFFNPKAWIIGFVFYSYPHYSSSYSVTDSFQWCVHNEYVESLRGVCFFGRERSCMASAAAVLRLINSNIFKHVSTTVHHC